MEKVRLSAVCYNHYDGYEEEEPQNVDLEIVDVLRSFSQFSKIEDIIGYTIDHVEDSDEGGVILTLVKRGEQ